MYKDFNKEFAQRTLENLRLFEENNDNTDKSVLVKFEVTQLINSLFGALIFLKEKNMPKPKTVLDDYDSSVTWLREEYGFEEKWVEKQDNTMENVIKHLRNSLAHGHIEPFPEGKEVEGFTFTDEKVIKIDRKNKINVKYWSVQLKLEAIKQLAIDIVTAAYPDVENPPQAS